VPAAVCRWGLCPRCPGAGRCLPGVYISSSSHQDSASTAPSSTPPPAQPPPPPQTRETQSHSAGGGRGGVTRYEGGRGHGWSWYLVRRDTCDTHTHIHNKNNTTQHTTRHEQHHKQPHEELPPALDKNWNQVKWGAPDGRTAHPDIYIYIYICVPFV